MLSKLKARRSTLVLIEQRLKFALALADRVVILSKGKVVFEATPEALDADPDTKQRYLGI